MYLELEILALGAALWALFAGWISHRTASPLTAIVARWSRWLAAGIVPATVLLELGWSSYPFWVLATAGGLGWFFLETVATWFAVGALSRSDYPLFPRFRPNTDGNEWPSQQRFIQLRERIRLAGFKRSQSLVATLGDLAVLRLSVFEDPTCTTRLHVVFLPTGRNNITACFAFHSVTEQGERVVTDNIFLAYGGFYPENWRLERRPWTRSFSALWERHLARLDALAQPLKVFEVDPEAWVNADQLQLEHLNRQLGFLNVPGEDYEEEGRISSAGRFRIWQEIWMLSYFGRARRY